MTKKSFRRNFNYLIFILFVVAILVVGLVSWNYIFKSNTQLEGKNFIYLKIPKSTDYAGLKRLISESGVISDPGTFDWYARAMKLDKQVHPGRYRINSGMSNRQIVKMIKNGNEEKVEININYTIRTKQQLIEKLTDKLNIEKNRITEFLDNEAVLERLYGLDKNTITMLVRPGKYSFSWSTDHQDFFDFMKKEFDNFWNQEKEKMLKKINRTKEEVMILASIVERESNIASEQRKIAGVYLNRLSKNMELQADPTVIFALNDFSLRRVSFKDLKIESPYNTYKNKGLPPGPIGFPSDKAINSVLNYQASNYLYFCAKPDLNGYSNFSSTLAEHEAFAQVYRESLNKKGILR